MHLVVGVGFGGWDDVFEKKGKMNNQCSFQTILLSVLTGEANGGVLGLTPESSFGMRRNRNRFWWT